MFRIFKNKAIYLLSTMLLIGALSYFKLDIQQLNSSRSSHDRSQVHEQFQQQINENEQLAWDLLTTSTQITKEQCLQRQQKNYPAHKILLQQNWRAKRSRYPKLKPETITFVQNVLRDFGIDPADVQIIPYKGKGSPAAADDCTIFIDETEFVHFSPEACKFFIAHEIAHLRAQDESIYESLCALKQTKRKKDAKKSKMAMQAFRRFQETRADMNALLDGGESYAQGAFDFMHKLQELDGGDNPGITHPKTSKRIEIAQNICSKMGWNVATA